MTGKRWDGEQIIHSAGLTVHTSVADVGTTRLTQGLPKGILRRHRARPTAVPAQIERGFCVHAPAAHLVPAATWTCVDSLVSTDSSNTSSGRVITHPLTRASRYAAANRASAGTSTTSSPRGMSERPLPHASMPPRQVDFAGRLVVTEAFPARVTQPPAGVFAVLDIADQPWFDPARTLRVSRAGGGESRGVVGRSIAASCPRSDFRVAVVNPVPTCPM